MFYFYIEVSDFQNKWEEVYPKGTLLDVYFLIKFLKTTS